VLAAMETPESETRNVRPESRVLVPTIRVTDAICMAREIFNSCGFDYYINTVLTSIKRIASFDIYSITIFKPDHKPIMLAGNLQDYVPRRTIENFLGVTYLLDAVYTACCSGVQPGLYRLSDLPLDEYCSRDIYNSADFHPCISNQAGSLAEEVVYMARPFDNVYLVLSLMRRKQFSIFTQEEICNLDALAPIVLDTMGKHWRPQISNDAASLKHQAASGLEEAFSTFATHRLSPRERTIVSLLLRGHSTLSIAYNLNIAEGTVKVHRRNIYEKLGISSQGQLFLKFFAHVLENKDLSAIA
jgi:DNA-binding CsgD family transcriptional regulator